MKRAFEAGFAVVSGATLSPFVAALLMAGILASLVGVSLSLSVFVDGLAGPLLSATIGSAAFLVTSMTSHAVTRRRETLLQRRFEQNLVPAVVRRMLEKPGAPKRVGERREVTALFTDVEGFSAMTRKADPTALVSTLDSYFDGMATIIVAHGGMIDKIVGDAVHALFNATKDLDDHPRKAVACAVALRAWSEAFRARPEAAGIGFGRTRIGIETGPAIVGDIGIHAKLDYTAHGDAINMAARLEYANKQLGSSICIGPTAASRCDQSQLRPLGTITVYGRDDEIAVFEPCRRDVSKAWQEMGLGAVSLVDADPGAPAGCLDHLVAARAANRMPRRAAPRMRADACG